MGRRLRPRNPVGMAPTATHRAGLPLPPAGEAADGNVPLAPPPRLAVSVANLPSAARRGQTCPPPATARRSSQSSCAASRGPAYVGACGRCVVGVAGCRRVRSAGRTGPRSPGPPLPPEEEREQEQPFPAAGERPERGGEGRLAGSGPWTVRA